MVYAQVVVPNILLVFQEILEAGLLGSVVGVGGINLLVELLVLVFC